MPSTTTSAPSEKRFTTDGPIRLTVKLASAAVDVTTADGDEATVVLDGPEKLLETTRVELAGNELTIDRPYPRFGGLFARSEAQLNVSVRVPSHSRVDVTTASGATVLDGDFGSLAMATASGSVRLTGKLDGDADVKTVSGNVELDDVAGDVTLRSVSGSVRVGRLHQGHAKVQTVSGNTELGIAAGTNVDVDANTASGELRSEIPLASAPGDDDGPTLVIRCSSVSGAVRIFRAS